MDKNKNNEKKETNARSTEMIIPKNEKNRELNNIEWIDNKKYTNNSMINTNVVVMTNEKYIQNKSSAIIGELFDTNNPISIENPIVLNTTDYLENRNLQEIEISKIETQIKRILISSNKTKHEFQKVPFAGEQIDASRKSLLENKNASNNNCLVQKEDLLSAEPSEIFYNPLDSLRSLFLEITLAPLKDSSTRLRILQAIYKLLVTHRIRAASALKRPIIEDVIGQIGDNPDEHDLYNLIFSLIIHVDRNEHNNRKTTNNSQIINITDNGDIKTHKSDDLMPDKEIIENIKSAILNELAKYRINERKEEGLSFLLATFLNLVLKNPVDHDFKMILLEFILPLLSINRPGNCILIDSGEILIDILSFCGQTRTLQKIIFIEFKKIFLKTPVPAKLIISRTCLELFSYESRVFEENFEVYVFFINFSMKSQHHEMVDITHSFFSILRKKYLLYNAPPATTTGSDRNNNKKNNPNCISETNSFPNPETLKLFITSTFNSVYKAAKNYWKSEDAFRILEILSLMFDLDEDVFKACVVAYNRNRHFERLRN